jgi:hypothetical protein
MISHLDLVQEKMFAICSKSLVVNDMARPPKSPDPTSVFSQRLHVLIADQFKGSRKIAANAFGLSRTHLSRVIRGGHQTQAATVALICRRVNDRDAVVGLMEGFLLDQIRLIQKGLGRSEWNKRRLVEIRPVQS